MKIKNISKKITGEAGININLINDLTLELSNSLIYSILAPAGAGKTTLLKILSGLEQPESGEIVLTPHTRTAYIPSGNVTFPWFNVNENFSLVCTRQELNDEIIKLIGLEGYENHYPDNNSHGFRLLTAIGMALLSGADLIAIDTPFNGLSDPMKIRIVSILRSIAEQKKVTFVLAASNISDSVLVSDKIFVMKSSPLAIDMELDVSFSTARNSEVLKTKEAEELKKRIVDGFNRQNIERAINISI